MQHLIIKQRCALISHLSDNMYNVMFYFAVLFIKLSQVICNNSFVVFVSFMFNKYIYIFSITN